MRMTRSWLSAIALLALAAAPAAVADHRQAPRHETASGLIIYYGSAHIGHSDDHGWRDQRYGYHPSYRHDYRSGYRAGYQDGYRDARRQDRHWGPKPGVLRPPPGHHHRDRGGRVVLPR